MNGAAAVPDSNTSTPKASTITTIGSSHHFLLFFRKYQNSAAMPVCLRVFAACSKSAMTCSLKSPLELPEIVFRARGPGFDGPVGRHVAAPHIQRVAPHQAKHEGHRREDQIEQDDQHELRHRPPDRER